MTTLIATSVVRGSSQGESHGGVYLIDLDNENVLQTVDWNTMDIDWQGRGWDRGLRGIAFDNDEVCIAGSDQLCVFSADFRMLASYKNPYLRHCHEISRYKRRLFLTSTGFDSILGFDLDRREFTMGLKVSRMAGAYRAVPFDPRTTKGPSPSGDLHLNSVFCNESGMFISGLRTDGMLVYTGRHIRLRVSLPQGTHNARPFRDGVLFNDTQADRVRFESPDSRRAFDVPRFDPAQLTHTDLDDGRIARQAFGRGLCVIDDNTVAGGSSPSTIALHDLLRVKTTRMVTLTFDIRNAIHGLEVWPFD